MVVEWGSVGEWVSGLAAFGGLVFAGLEIQASRRERSAIEERRIKDAAAHQEAMARAVGVRSKWGDLDREVDGRFVYNVDFTVHNGGEYPIENVVLVVVDIGSQEPPRPADQMGTALEIVFGIVLPGETTHEQREVSLGAQPIFAEYLGMVSVLFTDTWGQTWHKGPGVLDRRNTLPLID